MAADKDSERSERRLSVRLLLLVFFGILGAFMARSWAMTRAVNSSVEVLAEMSEALPQDELPEEPGEEFSFWPKKLIEDPLSQFALGEEGSPEDDVEAAPHGELRRRVKPTLLAQKNAPLGPEPRNSRASSEQVLAWANAGMIPSGVVRPRDEQMPAGIELLNVGALGLGLMDGDRLVTVDGAPVASRADVVGAVLSARGQGRLEMRAGLARLTEAGTKRFVVVVQQPYPTLEQVETMLDEQATHSAAEAEE